MRKVAFSGIIVVGLIVVGFIYMLRGCLSKYDERSAIPPALYFEKNGHAILFSLVKFEKTTSYSRNGGFTQKTVSTSYYIQNNDAVTGAKISEKRIKHHSDIKQHPVEPIAAVNNQAWLFIGELMIFDPFTLDLIADKSVLEEKNPSLKGRFPDERKYYDFHPSDALLYITMKDGSFWKMNSSSFIATALTEKPGDENGKDPLVAALNNQIKANAEAMDSLLEQKLRKPSRMLAAREISPERYNKLITGFNLERQKISRSGDSLRKLLSNAEKQVRSNGDARRAISNLNNRSGISFSQMKTNMDTVDGNWFGLYTSNELDKLYNHFQYQVAHEDAARRQLFISSIAMDQSDDLIINKTGAKEAATKNFYLNGGFLLDKATAKPVKTGKENSFLIVHKDELGNEGKILLSSVTKDGKQIWTFDSGLKDWNDWLIIGHRIFILGTNNRELSSSEINVLYSIDLHTGKSSKYDYFTDKIIDAK